MTPTDHKSQLFPYEREITSGAIVKAEPARAVSGGSLGPCIVAKPKSMILMGELIALLESIMCSAFVDHKEFHRSEHCVHLKVRVAVAI